MECSTTTIKSLCVKVSLFVILFKKVLTFFFKSLIELSLMLRLNNFLELTKVTVGRSNELYI